MDLSKVLLPNVFGNGAAALFISALLQCDVYLRAMFIQSGCLFEGDVYSKGMFI